MSLHVFGLTGGIGSGKSTVAGHFRMRGLPVVDADQLARDVVRPGTPALDEIVGYFGPEVLGSDGMLDRPALAEIVFRDEEARATLNGIVHPRVREAAREAFTAIESSGATLACYEVPLLFETGLHEIYRPVVVVSATPEAQLERAVNRDRAHARAIQARIAAQMPLAEKARQADYVIDNGGSLERTLEQADAVLEAVRREASLETGG